MRILLAVLVLLATAVPAGAADGRTSFLMGTEGVPSSRHPDVALTYHVRIRGHVSGDRAEFAALAAKTLNDPEGWSAGNRVAFVATPDDPDFILELAAPGAVADASPVCDRRYSCRVGDRVLVNDVRWRLGTRTYRNRSLREYREYVINHEVGHWLGLGHRECSQRGAAAPVMHQQSKGLGGCEARAWPLPREQAEALDNLASRR